MLRRPRRRSVRSSFRTPITTTSRSTLTPQQLAAIQAVETPLILVPASGNNNNGTVAWTYSIDDAKFSFLGPGETLTLTYLAQVETNAAPPFNSIVSAPITITIIGEHIPTIATTSGSITELPGTNNATIDHAIGTVTFTDADLTARPVVSAQFTSFTYQNAAHTDVTASLTAQQKADVAAVEASLALTPASTNANDGSVGWSYDVADSKLDFLARRRNADAHLHGDGQRRPQQSRSPSRSR